MSEVLLTSLAAVAQSNDAEATARGVTVMSRQRPDFDPLGVRLPGFRIDGALEAGPGYDDNLLPGRGARRSDGFVGEAVSVAGNTTWTRHALGIVASQATRQYFRARDLDWNDYTLGASGRYDIDRVWSVRASYNHIRSHLDVDNYDVQQEGTRVPIPFTTDAVQIAGTAALNRVRFNTAVDYRALRYDDVNSNGVRDTVSNNDYNTLLGEFSADYSFLPGRYVLGLVRLQDISYQRSGQSGRDSFTWEAQGGIQYDFTGLWRGRFLVGYRERNYDQPGIKSLSGPAFEGQITLMPSQLTTLALAAQRTIEESIRESSVSFTRTAARFTVDHELLRNFIVSGELRAERREYPRGGGNVTDGIAVASARLLLNRRMTLIGSYQHTERLEAPSGISEYGVNQVQLRLRLAL